MSDSSYNTELHSYFMSRTSDYEGTLVVISERAAQTVAELIAESCNTGHLIDIVFHGKFGFRQLWRLRCPSFSIYKYGRIYRIECLADFLHGNNIVYPHQVEAEAVNMIFLRPVAYRLNHKLTHHSTFACRFVAASGSIGKLSVVFVTVKISGYSTFKITSPRQCRMIIHDIHNHPDARPMQRHYHLFKLADAHIGFIRVGGIRTFGNIIILRIISPVILRLVELGLIDRREIERRQQMYMSYPQFFQMVDTSFLSQISMCTVFCQSQKLSTILDTRYRIDRKVTMVHFINNDIGETLQRRTGILFPPLWIGFFHVDNGSTVAVHTYSLRHETGSISLPHIVYLYIECIEASFQVTAHHSLPHSVGRLLHADHPVSCPSLSLFI